MNIEVSTVSHVGGWSACTSGRRRRRAGSPRPRSASPGCVISYGIAPYSMTLVSLGPLRIPPPWSPKYTTTLATIRTIVSHGVRSVGMESFRGITRETVPA